MKKVFFTTISIIAAAAMMLVSCGKDNKDDKGGNTPAPTVDPELVGTWTITGEAQGWAADGGVEMSESNNVWTATEVLVKGEGFKFVKDGAWTINLGAVEEGAKADNAEFDLKKDGENIVGAKDGYYDITLNLLTKKAKIAFVKDLPRDGQAFDYVMNISNYQTNSEFHFYDNPLTPTVVEWEGENVILDPKAITIQWKFYSTKWNNYDQVDEERGYKVWCNRLGQISTQGEKGFLFRFNDGGTKGSLRLNSDVLGTTTTGNSRTEYVGGYRAQFVWSNNAWHVLTVVADGENVRIYDNETQIYTYAVNKSTAYYQNGAPFERFDISMTWDDGTGYDKGQAFLGYQAYTRIWNKALTDEEIAATLCEVKEAQKEGLLIHWVWNLDAGSVVKNLGSAANYDLDFSKALAGGQQSFVNPVDVEAAWTDVNDLEGLAPVCAEPVE